MSVTTDTMKCGRCLALENILEEFRLSDSEVSALRSGKLQLIPFGISAEMYERMRALLEK